MENVLPISEYFESTEDNVAWEDLLGSTKTPTFLMKFVKKIMMQKRVIRTHLWKFFNPKNGRSFYQWLWNGEDQITDFLTINIALQIM